MRILFDQGTPVPLRSFLANHEVSTAYEKGWATLRNGELLAAAEGEGFEIFITTDQNLRHQQNLSVRSLVVVVLSTTSWPRIAKATDIVSQVIDNGVVGQVTFVQIP